MTWPALGEASVVRTILLDNDNTPKRGAQRWAREIEAKVGAGVWMWWTDGSHSGDGRVGATSVYKAGNQWRSRHSYLGTGSV